MGHREASATGGVSCFSSLKADLGADPGGRDRPRPAVAGAGGRGARWQEARPAHHPATLTLSPSRPLGRGWGREVAEEWMPRKSCCAGLPLCGVFPFHVP